jgi:hypothetical protein
MGKLNDSLPFYEQSLEYIASVKGKESGDYIESLLQYGELRLGHLDEAAQTYLSAKKILEACREQNRRASLLQSYEQDMNRMAIYKILQDMSFSRKSPAQAEAAMRGEPVDIYITDLYTYGVSTPTNQKRPLSDSTRLFRLMQAGASIMVLNNGFIFLVVLDKEQRHWKTGCRVDVIVDQIKGDHYRKCIVQTKMWAALPD